MSRTVKSFLVCATQDLSSGNTTVANLLNLQLAGLTRPAVAHLHAEMFNAVECSAAHLVALQHGGLAASHWLTCFPTDAGFCYEGGTLRTRSRVT